MADIISGKSRFEGSDKINKDNKIYAGLSQVWRAIDDARIIMPWVTHQQRVPMAFFAFRESQAKPTMLTHKLNKHKFTGKEKRK